MIGQRVFCVDSDEPSQEILKGYEEWIRNKDIYTVRDVITDVYSGHVIGVLLEEVLNSALFIEEYSQFREPAFGIQRFIFLPQDPILRNKILLNLRPHLN